MEFSAARHCRQWGEPGREVVCRPIYMMVGRPRCWGTNCGKDPSTYTLVSQGSVTSCGRHRWSWGLGDGWAFLSKTKMLLCLRLLQNTGFLVTELLWDLWIAAAKGSVPLPSCGLQLLILGAPHSMRVYGESFIPALWQQEHLPFERSWKWIIWRVSVSNHA